MRKIVYGTAGAIIFGGALYGAWSESYESVITYQAEQWKERIDQCAASLGHEATIASVVPEPCEGEDLNYVKTEVVDVEGGVIVHKELTYEYFLPAQSVYRQQEYSALPTKESITADKRALRKAIIPIAAGLGVFAGMAVESLLGCKEKSTPQA